jgi:phenylacetate-CoA ligase
MSKLTQMYFAMPYPLKTIAASIHGYKLKVWRYGDNLEDQVLSALERESWNHIQWQEYQQTNLEKMLDWAYYNVPYYKDTWFARRRKGDRSSHLNLENWPILTKEKLRKHPQAFLAYDVNPKSLFVEHTSGTTGTPLNLWCSREVLQRWYALVEARWRRWYGLSFKDRWGMLGGQLVTDVKRNKPPFWVWNFSLNQLYMSVLHLKPEWITDYAKAIEKHKIVYLYGYTSALNFLAQGLLDKGINIQMKAVITNAEPLYDFQRENIEECFKCSVYETYGQAEMVCAASECQSGSLHLWPEVGISEILDNSGFPTQAGKPGRLITTTLINKEMPLIRYDVLDYLSPTEKDHQCTCGRSLPMIKNVIGRNDDMILLRDGRRVFQIDTIFGPHFRIKEAQIIQETLDEFTIKVVPDVGFSEREIEELQIELLNRLGQVDVKINTVQNIERTWRGKFRIIISKVTNPHQDQHEVQK